MSRSIAPLTSRSRTRRRDAADTETPVPDAFLALRAPNPRPRAEPQTHLDLRSLIRINVNGGRGWHVRDVKVSSPEKRHHAYYHPCNHWHADRRGRGSARGGS